MRGLCEDFRERRYLRARQEIAMIEGYADPDSPNPAHRPLPKRRWRTLATGAGLLSFIGPLSMPTLEAFVPSDRQERLIEGGVHSAIGDTSLKVTCLADTQMVVAGLPGPKEGIGIPRTGLTWDSQSACNAVEQFAQKPLTTGDLEKTQLGNDAAAKIKGLRLIAHETAHAVLDTWDEPTAECYALQLAPDMAVAYGMDPQLTPQLQEQLLGIMIKDHQSGDPEWKEYRFDLASCRSGGSADLSVRGLGTQAHFPSK